MAYPAICVRLDHGEVVLLDGGIGTELIRRGVYWRGHGLERAPDVVRAVHRDYIAAGADVITTNTFQLTRRAYLSQFHDLGHLRRIGVDGLEQKAARLAAQAVALARQARDEAGREVAIAGAVAPVEHCFRPDLAPPPEEARAEHRETARQLAQAGVDLILLEAMNRVAEARAALEAARETGLPVWISLLCDEQARLLGGEPLSTAIAALEPLGPEVILLNCAPPPDITVALRELVRTRRGPTGAYAHIGRYDPPSWKFTFFPRFTGTEAYPPARYLEEARTWVGLGAQVIGGCCGTTPDHIRALRAGLPRRVAAG